MGFNRRPLVLGFNDTTLIPSGLVEVVLNLSDNGDVCDTKPSDNQVLAWDGTEWCGSSIQFTGGGGGGSFTCADLNSCDLSALSNVCSDGATPGQALAFNGSQYCPSSLNFIHNGAGNVTVNPKLVMSQVPTIGGSDVLSQSTGDTRYATAAQGDTADAAMPKSGGAFTGPVTTNSTFDGVDIATRDAVLTTTTNTANAAMPKSGGAFTGPVTTNSTIDGVDIATRDAVLTTTTNTANAAMPKSGGAFTGAVTTNSTIDGVDIATRDGVLTTTTNTANAALPKSTASNNQIYFKNQSGNVAGLDCDLTAQDFISTGAKIDKMGNVAIKTTDVGTPLVITQASPLIIGTAQNLPNSQVIGTGSLEFAPVFNSTTSGTSYTLSNVVTVPVESSGVGDVSSPTLLFFSGNDASSTAYLTLNSNGSSLIESGSAASISAENITATTQVSAPTVRGGTSVLGTLGSFTNVGATNVTGTNIVANTLAPFVGESATTLSVTANEINLSGDLNIPDYTSLTGAGVPMVLHRQVGAPVASSNSTSLAELVSFTLPANSLAIGDIDIRIRGRQLAQGSNLRWNFKIGGTNILNSNISQGTFSDMTVYNMHIQISKTETDKQLVTANFTQSTGSGSAAGRGSWAGTHRVGQITNDGVTADESTALALSLEAQQANSAQIVTVDQFRVTLIPDPA